MRRRFACSPVRLSLLVLALLTPGALSAQVGFDPARSPYNMIRHGRYWMLSAGQFGGSGGRVAAAPHDGKVLGLQVNFLADKTMQVGVGAFYGSLERRVLDPNEPPENQFVRIAQSATFWIDANLHFNLTGGKTWRGLAPFFGGAVGLSITEAIPDDPGAFQHRAKIYLAPLAGTRFFLSDRMYLQAEGRMHLWQVKHPQTFGREPPLAPGTPDAPHAILPDGRLNEWSASPWVQLGVAYTLRIPWPF